MTDTLPQESIEEEVLKIIPNILSTSNVLHIALLVYLRFIAITRPLKYEDTHRRHHNKSPIFIWLLSIVANLFPSLVLCVRIGSEYHLAVILFILHTFHTIPIILIVLMYTKMIKVISKRNERMSEVRISQLMCSEAAEERERIKANNKLSTNMIKWVALCLIICYFPYLLWWQYARSYPWNDESGCKVEITKFEVRY